MQEIEVQGMQRMGIQRMEVNAGDGDAWDR